MEIHDPVFLSNGKWIPLKQLLSYTSRVFLDEALTFSFKLAATLLVHAVH